MRSGDTRSLLDCRTVCCVAVGRSRAHPKLMSMYVFSCARACCSFDLQLWPGGGGGGGGGGDGGGGGPSLLLTGLVVLVAAVSLAQLQSLTQVIACVCVGGGAALGLRLRGLGPGVGVLSVCALAQRVRPIVIGQSTGDYVGVARV